MMETILRVDPGTGAVRGTLKGEVVAVEAEMTRLPLVAAVGVLALAAAGCGTTVEQKAATGAVAGAVVAGPVGAAVGGAAGTVVGQAERPR